MRQYVSKYVVCPFYRKEEAKKLFCEGVEDGTGLMIQFDSQEHRFQFRERFCYCENWVNCRLARMLNEKYS